MSDESSVPIDRLMRLVTAVFVVVLAYLVAGAITLPVSAAAVSVGLVEDGTTAWQVLRTVVQFAGFLAATVGYLVVAGEWDRLGLSRLSASDLGLVVGAGVGLYVFQYAALELLGQVGITTGQNQATVPAGDPVAYFAVMIAVSLLVVGPVEELLFRGVVQGGLRRAFDAAPAILIASAMFGLVHLPGVGGSSVQRWAYVAIAVILGCVLGVLYERTDNVAVPGLAHGLYNAVIYGILLLDAL